MVAPPRIKPMLAKDNPYDNPFDQPDYILQEKYDGTRIVAIKQGSVWHLMTRHWKNDVANNFPEIIRDLNQLKVNNTALDCELTFFNKSGKGKFLTVLANPDTKKGLTAKLMVFDIIKHDGKDLTKYPLTQRLDILSRVIPNSLRYVNIVKTITTPSSFKKVYSTISKNNGEGVMMKKKNSQYTYDTRDNWVKVKNVYTEDCVVLGLTYGNGKRAPTFGALILGEYDNGKMRIVGKASGFNDATLLKLYSMIMKMPAYTYDGLSLPDAKKWVAPKYVAEVKYYEKTNNNILRHPVFIRLRDDKSPKDCKIMR